MQGRGFRLISFNIGPKGIRASYTQLDELMATEPSVVHLQDVKVPHRKVAKVCAALIMRFPHYLPIFNVSANPNGPSLCT